MAGRPKMRWARRQNASSTMDAANDNARPENRTTNGRETKDEMGRRLQKRQQGCSGQHKLGTELRGEHRKKNPDAMHHRSVRKTTQTV